MILSTNSTLAVTSLGSFDTNIGGSNLLISGRAISRDRRGAHGIVKEGGHRDVDGREYIHGINLHINAGVLALDYSAAREARQS